MLPGPTTFLRTRVARRILGLFLFCVIVPVVLLATVVYRHVSGQLLEQAQARLVASSRTVSMELLRRLQRISASVERASVSVELRPKEWAPDSVLRPSLRDQGILALVVERDGRWQMLAGRPGALPELPMGEDRHLLTGRPALVVDTAAGAPRLWMVRTLESRATLLWAEVNPSFLWGADGGRDLVLPEQDLCVLVGPFPLLCTRPIEPTMMRAGLAGRGSTLDWEGSGDRYIAGFSPIVLTFEYGTDNWLVVLSESSRSVLAPLAAFQRSFALVIVLALVAVAVMSHRQLTRSLRPLEQLREGTQRVAREDFSHPVRVEGSDEFADLAHSFNAMTERLQVSFIAMRASHRIDQVALTTPDARRIADTVLDQSPALVPGHRLLLLLAGPQPGDVWQLGRQRGEWQDVALPPDVVADIEGIDDALELGPADAGRNLLLRALGVGADRWLVLPLRQRGRLAGVALIGSQDRPGAEALAMTRRLVDQLAMALSHATLFRELDELGWGALRALARAIDANSPWTAGHSERVALLAIATGREMGLGAPDLDRLHRGGLLHDVGKIGVPADVLNKAGRLSPDELDLVRAHPALGARILSPIQAYADLLPLVLSHHELLDGSGYPNQLQGDEIPPLVRVLTVADVFDALVSERPYRGAWNARKALDYIAGGAGHTFDPAVASAFHEVLRRGSHDIWLAYPALKGQLERAGGFARSSAHRGPVFVS